MVLIEAFIFIKHTIAEQAVFGQPVLHSANQFLIYKKNLAKRLDFI